MEEKQLVFHNCNSYIISSAEIFKVEINATTSFKCFVFKLSRMHLTLNIVSWAFRYILPLVLIIIKLKTLSDTKKNVTSLYEVQCALCLQGWLDWEFVSTNPRKYIYIYRIPMAIFSSFTNAGLLEYYMKWNVLSFYPLLWSPQLLVLDYSRQRNVNFIARCRLTNNHFETWKQKIPNFLVSFIKFI